ncbi:MerR family DNA-binding protein [Streptomyces lasalocidi]
MTFDSQRGQQPSGAGTAVSATKVANLTKPEPESRLSRARDRQTTLGLRPESKVYRRRYDHPAHLPARRTQRRPGDHPAFLRGCRSAARRPHPVRVPGVRRAAVERLAFIGAAKHLGLPLEEVGELLTVWEDGACGEVRADLRPRIAARLAEAEQRTAELRSFTSSLRQALQHLDSLPDRAEQV